VIHLFSGKYFIIQKILLSISELIRNKSGFIIQNISTELLIYIIPFLPYKYVMINQNVCKNWMRILKSNLSKKILFLPTPREMRFSRIINTEYNVDIMTTIKDDIILYDYNYSYKINTKNLGIIKTKKKFSADLISSNENYVCYIKFNYITILPLNEKKHYSNIHIFQTQGLAIDQNNLILVPTRYIFHIFNLEGTVIKSWGLTNNSFNSSCRNIAVYEKNIYMVDSAFNRIDVFSYEGKLIRRWGKKGTEPGNFESPHGIAIYQNLVFITDPGNARIQVFTLDGKFVFKYENKNEKYINDILIRNSDVYLNYRGYRGISEFKLIYY